MSIAGLGTLALFLGFVSNASSSPRQDQGEKVLLLSLDPVARTDVDIRKERVAVGGVVFDGAILGPRYNITGGVTYDLSKKYGSVMFAVGLPDDGRDTSGSRFRVLVEGKIVMEGEMKERGTPVRRTVDVTGKRSLRFEIDGGLAICEPTLVGRVGKAKVPTPATKRNAAPSQAAASVTSAGVSLTWPARPGAVSYCVVLILARPGTSPVPSKRISTYEGLTAPNLKISIGKLSKGDYDWQVIAIGREGVVLGSPAPGKRFITP